MKTTIAILSAVLFLSLSFQNCHCQIGTKHFIFFSQDRENIYDSAFYLNPGVSGAQVTYPWRRLEPLKDQYDFSEIEEDMNFLNSKGKKLFVQLQDVTFDSAQVSCSKIYINRFGLSWRS